MTEADDEVLAVEYDTYGGPEVLKLRRRAAPQPGPRDVLVEVCAVSMNPVDWKVREGILQKYFPIPFPAIPGRDGAGEVISAGADADLSLVGQRVCFHAPRNMHLGQAGCAAAIACCTDSGESFLRSGSRAADSGRGGLRSPTA